MASILETGPDRPVFPPAEKSYALSSCSQLDSALLGALFDFIQPVVRSCTPTTPDNVKAHGGRSYGYEGKELLGSLRRFIAATVERQAQSQDTLDLKQGEPTKEFISTVAQQSRIQLDGTGASDLKEDEPVNAFIPLTIDVTSKMSKTVVPDVVKVISPRDNQLKTLFQEKVRMLVFNVMPIRIMTFNKNGKDIRLLDRNEVLSHIMLSVFDKFKQSKTAGQWNALSNYELERLTNDAAKIAVRYAILSHEWIRGEGPGDVVYGTWKTGAFSKNGSGYAKIENFCQAAARNHGVTFGWMDTVCINQDSSSELDESIRSMYKWYKNAHVCITYLSKTQVLENMHSDTWFTRGWTLQELLAPRQTSFYTAKWENLACEVKMHINDRDVRERSEPTKIDIQIQMATTLTWNEMLLLKHSTGQRRLPVSRVMQLAATRQVTREEDAVYSLMGLLGVQIAVAYGEGTKRALGRLIREVLSSITNPMDVFNHRFYDTAEGARNSLIPSQISDYNNRLTMFDEARSIDFWIPSKPILPTHLGVRVPVLLVPARRPWRENPKYQNYEPLGDFSGIVDLEFEISNGSLTAGTSSPTQLYLLDHTLYKKHTGRSPLVVTLAVINFMVPDNYVYIPPTCFSISLDCCEQVGDVRSSDPVTIISHPHPIVFQFYPSMSRFEAKKTFSAMDQQQHDALQVVARHEPTPREIPINDLKRHGMQLLTLYL